MVIIIMEVVGHYRGGGWSSSLRWLLVIVEVEFFIKEVVRLGHHGGGLSTPRRWLVIIVEVADHHSGGVWLSSRRWLVVIVEVAGYHHVGGWLCGNDSTQ